MTTTSKVWLITGASSDFGKALAHDHPDRVLPPAVDQAASGSHQHSSHTQLPHPGSVKDQPKHRQLSNEDTAQHQPRSYRKSAPEGIRTPNLLAPVLRSQQFAVVRNNVALQSISTVPSTRRYR
ncbi:hypothetical protein MINS_03840 [Mycolicibacterium insubricum]|nr:hypothetical protein MINS_03840 [Mycolicibacterium insubricum]